MKAVLNLEQLSLCRLGALLGSTRVDRVFLFKGEFECTFAYRSAYLVLYLALFLIFSIFFAWPRLIAFLCFATTNDALLFPFPLPFRCRTTPRVFFCSTLTPVWKQLGLLWDMQRRGLIDSKFNDF